MEPMASSAMTLRFQSNATGALLVTAAGWLCFAQHNTVLAYGGV
jgi:hypothetical protein